MAHPAMRHFFIFGNRDMIPHPNFFLTMTLFAAALSACDSTLSTPAPVSVTQPESSPPHWLPPLSASWQIQYTGAIDISLPVDIYNLDLFDTSPETIADLHARGVKVICYFSAGSFEDWRPDAGDFPASILGNDLDGWPGEKWLDIRNLQVLAPLMLERIILAAQKGCDGVDPDNVNAYTNDSGFPLTAEDQITYNIFLSNAAHQKGLGIGLKNDLEQVTMLLPFFDWALNEECFYYKECDLLLPFVNAGKSVFVIEYRLRPEEFCIQSVNLNFNAMQKKIELDAFRLSCRG
jgi:hypothetical protein